MARQITRRAGGARRAGSALRDLIAAVAEQVVERSMKQLPAREQVKALEREIREIGRRLDSIASLGGGRRPVGRPRLNRRCKSPGCGGAHVAHGFCSKHYQAWRRKRMRRDTASRRRR